jgi:hypothetical protein
VAAVTQDVGVAGNLSATVTFDNVTGVVSDLTLVNTSTVALRFDFTVSGVLHSVTVPVGTTKATAALLTAIPALVQGADLTWDWLYAANVTSWQLNGD